MQQAGGKRWSDERAICAQIDEHEAANWLRTRPQENSEPAGAGAGKCHKNGDAAAYGRAFGKNTRSRNLEVPDLAGSKSSAPANGNLARKKLMRQSRGSGERVANDAAPDAEDF